jgi:hypothetical protein
MRRKKWIALVALAALVAVPSVASAIGNGSGAERVNATFTAGAIGNPNLKTCAVTRDGTFVKFTADYTARLVTDREQVLVFQFIGDKIIANVETGLGTAKGKWDLVDPTTGATVGSGVSDAVFIGEPNSFEDPNQFGGNLYGMIRGFEDPNERTIIWLFSASLTDGGRTLSGFIGDRNLMPAAAILFPPDPCVR